jgi:hypothetical protein
MEMGMTAKAKFLERAAPIVTLANAEKWAELTDKYLFVEELLDGLEIAANDARVELIESEFNNLLWASVGAALKKLEA